jgi:hypothetical protein
MRLAPNWLLDLRKDIPTCRFRKLHLPEWRLFPNQNMIPFDDYYRLPFRPHGVRIASSRDGGLTLNFWFCVIN